MRAAPGAAPVGYRLAGGDGSVALHAHVAKSAILSSAGVAVWRPTPSRRRPSQPHACKHHRPSGYPADPHTRGENGVSLPRVVPGRGGGGKWHTGAGIDGAMGVQPRRRPCGFRRGARTRDPEDENGRRGGRGLHHPGCESFCHAQHAHRRRTRHQTGRTAALASPSGNRARRYRREGPHVGPISGHSSHRPRARRPSRQPTLDIAGWHLLGGSSALSPHSGPAGMPSAGQPPGGILFPLIPGALPPPQVAILPGLLP